MKEIFLETEEEIFKKEDFEKYLELKLGSSYDQIIKLYIEEKCTQNPMYFSEINNHLFTGICNKINKEKAHSSEVEKGFISALEIIEDCKVDKLIKSKKYSNYFRIVLETLNIAKYWRVDSLKSKFNKSED